MKYLIYQPAEDTFFLLESVIRDGRVHEHPLIIEIGVGTGYILIELLKDNLNLQGIGVDINVDAVSHFLRLSRKEGVYNRVLGVVGDLETALSTRNSFPLFVFNPPYLPEEPSIDSKLSLMERVALTGGKKGYELSRRFVLNLEERENYRAYFLLSSLAITPQQFFEDMNRRINYHIIDKKSWFYETLYCIRIEKHARTEHSLGRNRE